MRLLLTILLFTTLTARAQIPFKLGDTYRDSYVVWYPAEAEYKDRVYWKVKQVAPFKAKKTPDKDPEHWMPHTIDQPKPDNKPSTPTDQPAPVVPAHVRQSAFDSLLARVQQLEARPQYNVISRAEFDTVAKKVGSLEKSGSVTFRVAQTGIPLIKKINDSTYEFPALTAGLIDSASRIVIKKAAIIKPTKKTAVKK